MIYDISMDMFVALSDPTRRAILEILASSGELSATAIYEHFPVSPQAISQHLKALREAKLVVMEKRAQKHLYRLNQETLSQFEAWVQQTRQRWEERFSALDTILEREKQKLVKDEQESPALAVERKKRKNQWQTPTKQPLRQNQRSKKCSSRANSTRRASLCFRHSPIQSCTSSGSDQGGSP